MNFRQATIGTLAAAIVFAAGTASATTLGYWRFEDGAPGTNAVGAGSITDETGAHHGTPVGDPNYQSLVPASTVPQTGAANNTSLFFDGLGVSGRAGRQAVLRRRKRRGRRRRISRHIFLGGSDGRCLASHRRRV